MTNRLDHFAANELAVILFALNELSMHEGFVYDGFTNYREKLRKQLSKEVSRYILKQKEVKHDKETK